MSVDTGGAPHGSPGIRRQASEWVFRAASEIRSRPASPNLFVICETCARNARTSARQNTLGNQSFGRGRLAARSCFQRTTAHALSPPEGSGPNAQNDSPQAPPRELTLFRPWTSPRRSTSHCFARGRRQRRSVLVSDDAHTRTGAPAYERKQTNVSPRTGPGAKHSEA